jgi:hypothetical protein
MLIVDIVAIKIVVAARDSQEGTILHQLDVRGLGAV